MLTRSLTLISIIFLMSSCAHKPAAPSQPIAKAAAKTQHTPKLAAFNRVDVKGLINVNLHTGYSRPKVILHGDARDLRHVKTTVINGTLYIVLGKGYPDYGSVTADIQGQYLNYFSYEGKGVIKGTQLRSSSLSLCLKNEGSTQLKGQLGIPKLEVHGTGLTKIEGLNSKSMTITTSGKPRLLLHGKANLTQLNLKGNSWLAFYWVNSPSLTVRAHGCSTIQLAGATDRLDVELWGCSKFKGRYLSAKRSFVKTHGTSLAEITTVDKQHTLASDSSDIYYYNIPNMHANFMAFDGSILDMREWPLYALEEYDRYNKHIP